MQQTSEFQKRFPLSKRKFTKKMLSKAIPYFLLSLILGTFSGGFYTMFLAMHKSAFNLAGFVLTIIASVIIFLIIIFAIYGFYVEAYIKRYFYDANDSFITIKKKVFTPTEIHIQYQKIQDVYVDQDLLDRILGIYDVHIASATVSSGIEAHIDGVNVDVAEELKNFILDKIRNGGNSSVASNVGTANTSIPAVINFKEEISSRTYPISSKWLLSSFFGDVITSLFYVFLAFYFIGVPSKHSTTSLGDRVGLDVFWYILVAVLVFVVTLAWRFVWQILWKNSFYFEFKPEFIAIKQGVISKEERHLPYKSVQDIAISQSLTEKIFGIATVVIENAAVGTGNLKNSSGKVKIPGLLLSQGNQLVQQFNQVLSKSASSASMGL